MLQTILVLNVLAYGPPGGSIQGGVWLEVATSPNSLVGLGEVEVQLLLAGKTISSIRTAKTGTFRFIALAPGKYSVRAVPPHDKYFTNTDDGTWLGATQIGSTSDRIRGIDFKMKAAVVSEDPEWPPLKYSSRAIAGGPNSLQFAIRRQPTGRVANFSTPDQDGMLQASPLHLASGPSGGSIQGGVWLEDGKIPTSAVGLGGVEVQLLSAGKCSCAVLHSTYECILPVVFSGQDVKGAPMEVAPPPRDLSYSNLAGGTVTSIDRTSITVQGLDVRVKGAKRIEEGLDGRIRTYTYIGNSLTISGSIPTMDAVRISSDCRGDFTVTHADGSTTEIRRSEQPHRLFILSDTLRAGYQGIGRAGESYSYRISDLQVDDYVEMQLVKTFFEPPVCTAIRISRRSGGRVPPAPGEVEERERRPSNRPMWHERVNALQDWEEKGIPVPIRFLSTSERLEHVAPPPRLKQ